MTDQQVAVLTGAANGIGWALARTFARAGYAVALFDIDGDAARARARELSGNHEGFGCDVSDETQVDAAFAAVDARFGRLDALVNNAGIVGSQEPSTEQDMQYFDRITKVIVNGTFLCSRAAYHAMERGGKGAIVNVGSIAGLVGLPRRNSYGAAKAGVHSLTRSLACEWASKGIRVNAVAPGYVATSMVKGLIDKGAIDPARLSRRIPMGRLGTPEEIAEAILFLASDSARYITGSTLSVDGGWAAFGDVGNASEG
ncbi:SDR family oxidoreductase [Mesorhizobium sp. M7A.F.Ca.US.006.01.1.1]|nr:SDR family oxidoreductase [Mesorhizobium sp. M7A.F.Ca.US.006.01.1.1]